jgi:hypothetical protein
MKGNKNFQPASYWQKHLEAWTQSNLSQKAYCIEYQLAPSTFYKWRRKLMDKLPALSVSDAIGAQDSSEDFIELTATPETNPISVNSTQAWDIELQLGADIILRMSQR